LEVFDLTPTGIGFWILSAEKQLKTIPVPISSDYVSSWHLIANMFILNRVYEWEND